MQYRLKAEQQLTIYRENF